MRKLNKKYLGKDSPTDVLAFDLKDNFTPPHQKATGVNPQMKKKILKGNTQKPPCPFKERAGLSRGAGFTSLNLLGEIFISVEEAKRNSKIFSTDIHEELLLYVIHGLLHLIGFKDKTASQRMRMKKKEKEVLSYIFKEEKKNISSLFS